MTLGPSSGEHDGEAELARQMVIREPEYHAWDQLARDLTTRVVLSAELASEVRLDSRLRPQVLAGHLLVESHQAETADMLLEIGWRMCAAPAADDGVLVLLPPLPSVVESVSRDEFGRHIEGDLPLSTIVDPREVSFEDEVLFGPFASGQLGGSCALLALSGSNLMTRSVALRNPAALGLIRVDDSPFSLTASPVSCSATGLSPQDDLGPKVLDSVREPNEAALLWSARRPGIANFWLLLQLEIADEDPPVWIPAGQVFEQATFTGRQTLATTADAGTIVAPGRRSTLLLPAYCLDPHLDPPASNPMRVTPFSAPAPGRSRQQQVWQDRVLARGGVQ
jgi:hypothetical protein